MKNFKLLSVALLAMLLFAVPVMAKEVKIGYVDFLRALNECDEGLRAKERLEAEAKSIEEELNKKQEVLKTLKDEIDKKEAVWNEETAVAKKKEFNEKAEEFQMTFNEVRGELAKKQKQSEQDIIIGLTDTVKRVAKDTGYRYVFERGTAGLVYAPDSDDLTDKVVEEYNKQTRQEKK